MTPLLMLALVIFALPALAQPPVSATGGWVREAPPGAHMTAGYLTLHNASRDPVALAAVTSPQYQRVELHRSTVEDGVARMERVERLEIPARGSVTLEPGGLHLMLMRPHGPPGVEVLLEFQFEDGWMLEVVVPIHGVKSHPRSGRGGRSYVGT